MLKELAPRFSKYKQKNAIFIILTASVALKFIIVIKKIYVWLNMQILLSLYIHILNFPMKAQTV